MRRSGWLVAAAAFCFPVSAEQVILKSGGRVSGVLIERTATRVVLQVGPGTVALPMTSVERIIDGTSPLATFQDRASRLGGGDREGWTELGIWARDQGLDTQARDCFARVLALDPSSPIAQSGVGNVMVDGRWLNQEEAYRARGYVRFEGLWMFPDERDTLLRERAEQHADQRAEADRRARVAEAEAQARAAEAAARAQAATDWNSGIPLGYAMYGSGYGVPGGGYGGPGGGYGRARGRFSDGSGLPRHASLEVPPPRPPTSSLGTTHPPAAPSARPTAGVRER
jgi:hypothetical protein